MATWNSVISRIERKRQIAGKSRGFDFTFVEDKKFPKKLDDGKPFLCKWCLKPMYIGGINRNRGDITVSCTTDECIGNIDTPEHIVKRKFRELGLDTKLNFNGRKSLLNRMTNQQWMDKYNPS